MNADSLCAAYRLSTAVANSDARSTKRRVRRTSDCIAGNVPDRVARSADRHAPSFPADRADASAPHVGLRSRLAVWWRNRLRRRDERIQLETLAPLSKQMLQDIGMSEELRSLAMAQHESQYERLTRSVDDLGRIAGRLGTW